MQTTHFTSVLLVVVFFSFFAQSWTVWVGGMRWAKSDFCRREPKSCFLSPRAQIPQLHETRTTEVSSQLNWKCVVEIKTFLTLDILQKAKYACNGHWFPNIGLNLRISELVCSPCFLAACLWMWNSLWTCGSNCWNKFLKCNYVSWSEDVSWWQLPLSGCWIGVQKNGLHPFFTIPKVA